MIFESSHWKDDLIQLSEKLRNHYCKLKIDCDDKYLVDFEKDIFIATYSIRKLIEAGKISDDLINSKFNIRVYKAKRTVHKLNWHELDKNYESKYTKSKKYLRTICNTFIHSYCFIPRFDKNNNFMCIYFNSAEQKDTEIYSITLKELSLIFEKIGYDYPNESKFTFSKDINDYIFYSKTIYPGLEVLYPYKKKIDNGELSIKQVSKYLSIPEYKIKEILTNINEEDIKNMQKHMISLFAPMIEIGEITPEDFSNDYDIDLEVINNYLDIISKKEF